MSPQHHDDFAFEPVRGLPAELPEGERMVWQGAPEWKTLAVNAFHVRKVAIYFAVLAAWIGISAAYDGLGTQAALMRAGWLVLVGAAGCGILAVLAYLYARSTVYTITTKRVVIRSGLALPVTLNLPYARIAGAALGVMRGGTGNIALAIAKPDRLAYLLLWPNTRPLHFLNPQPMLRAIPDADATARLLAACLAGEPLPTETRTRALKGAGETQTMPAGIGAMA